ncbi:SURF1 family protein [Roseomonas sp. NAR14]|uniref:SURF1-like protein n=1 Tax=Roseomonas acroporae TaxID=2937791 RepID=A0A9X2BVY0_9PROT|nr:SURF1 family cytochrome oxidase biogenesis protein [Roseomonas acroporae]MCK8783210.1 SURF1 family protein [Roseomonas acroporae]
MGERWRRLLVPALAALPVLAILLGLGTWQVQRLHWKNALLAELDASEAGPAVPLGAAPPAPWAKVVATGRFDHAREVMLGSEVRSGGGNPMLGAHLVTPLLRPGLPPLLVDRGWVPLERRAPVWHPEGEVSVVGYVRPGETAGWVSASDDPAGRRFFTFDPARIGAAVGLPGVAPFGLVALARQGGTPGGPGTEAPPGNWPEAARSLPRPGNSHLGYAITWYGLALSLVGVFVAFARRRLQE